MFPSAYLLNFFFFFFHLLLPPQTVVRSSGTSSKSPVITSCQAPIDTMQSAANLGHLRRLRCASLKWTSADPEVLPIFAKHFT